MTSWRYPRKQRKATAPPLRVYQKLSLTFEQQAKQLLDRGMVGDAKTLERRLRVANYYRLTGYFHFFRVHQGPNVDLGEQFRPGTTFDLVWEHYTFDSKLRALTTAAIEKIEIAIRTLVSFHHGKKFGPFGYALDPRAIKIMKWDPTCGREVDRRDDFIDEVQTHLERSSEIFIEHFYEKYTGEYPPIWVTSEVLSLGCLKRLYDGSPDAVQSDIARELHLTPKILRSWLLTLNTARNVCAHHGRFWNRSLGSKPAVPTDEMWHKPVTIFALPYKMNGETVNPPTTFAILSICNYLLDEIDPGCGWSKELVKLLDAHKNVSRRAMGFPENWRQSPIWYDCD